MQKIATLKLKRSLLNKIKHAKYALEVRLTICIFASLEKILAASMHIAQEINVFLILLKYFDGVVNVKIFSGCFYMRATHYGLRFRTVQLV